jgi:PAS domain S-box-containing protein
VYYLVTQPYRQVLKAVSSIPKRSLPVIRLIQTQVPALLAITATLVLTSIKGESSGVYTIIVLLLLTPTAYTPLRFGLRSGLISAFILATFNAYLLSGTVRSLTLTDPSLRTIALIGVVLLALALIIGRLKERNDYLLQREQTARLQAEDNEQRLRFMAESMPQKIFTTKPDGTAEYANRQWFEYAGSALGDQPGEDWVELVHPADSEENVRRWQRSLATGNPFEYEHRLRRADGTYRWHITRAQPMHDEHGAIILWVGSSTDIEDIRRTRKLEADTARLTKQRAELMALNTAKDEFISLASHQLRTPATAVKQFLGMVLEGYGGRVPQKQLKLLKQAYASNERQLTIVEDLLKVAQVDAGKVKLQKETVDLVALIKDVIQGQTAKFSEHGQTVIFKPRPRSVTAKADPDRLRMVLENIIDNASKYSTPGKTIEVKTAKSKGITTITVRDEGVGINPRHAEKIFDKFSRLDNPLSVLVGGTGLGLYWAKKIIDLHDGTITVTSIPGKGSTFTISLPASSAAASTRRE